jgi:HSP20 family molecular chaperone IbpA
MVHLASIPRSSPVEVAEGMLTRLRVDLADFLSGPVDLFREGDQYILNADLPGIDPGSVDVDVDGRG